MPSDKILEPDSTEDITPEEIESKLQSSIVYYSALKAHLTTLEHDFLTYVESKPETGKYHIRLPLSYSDASNAKAELKSAILSHYPYAYWTPFGRYSNDPIEKELVEDQADGLSHFYSAQLELANSGNGWKGVLEDWLLQACVLGTAFAGINWRSDMRPIPEFEQDANGNWMPAFDDNGNRKFVDRLVFDGIELYCHNVDDVFLPAGCTSVKGAPWKAIKFRATLKELENAIRIVALKNKQTGTVDYQTKPVYFNLDKLKQLNQYATLNTEVETQRKKSAFYQQNKMVGANELLEFVTYITDKKIYVKPVGQNFFIKADDNYTRIDQIGAVYIEPRTNEPYGLGINSASQKINRMQDHICEILMDAAVQEVDKNWLVGQQVTDFELRPGGNNIIHVENGDQPVGNFAQVIQTRQMAQEFFQFQNWADMQRQRATGGADVRKGLPQVGMETAFEVGQAAAGGAIKPEDRLHNLEASLGVWLFNSMQDLFHLNFNRQMFVQSFGEDNSVLKEFNIDYDRMPIGKFRFQWADRVRDRMSERGQLTQVGQMLGSIRPENMNPALIEIIRQILLLGGSRSAASITKKMQGTQTPMPNMGQQAPQMGMPVENASDVAMQTMTPIGQGLT